VNFDEYIQERLRLFRQNRKDLFFSLINLGPSAVPHLIAAYRAETNLAAAEALVEVIWQYRLPETLSFLAEVLEEDQSDLWKQALDGIVALGGEAAIAVLRIERNRLSEGRDRSRLAWIEQAIDQVTAQMAEGQD
jgi:hypothetical protein